MRRELVAALATLACGLACTPAGAHRIDEYLQATLVTVEADRIVARMRLVPGEQVAARVIAAIDTDGDGAFSPAEQRAYAEHVLHDLSTAIDGRARPPRLTTWRYPTPAQMLEGLGEIHFDYTIDLPVRAGMRSLVLTNRHLPERSVYLANVLVPRDPTIRILDQQRDPHQASYRVDFCRTCGSAEAPRGRSDEVRSSWNGVPWSAFFRLGMAHIAEGSDHLMFLLVLLLPAPLAARGGRWAGAVGPRRGAANVLWIVTAFTIGHSITLTLAAVDGLTLPDRWVETAIALSILVSAVHAWRPLFPGREPAVAAGFGLVHGLAFAATLERLGVGRWDRIAGTLTFNVGIEAMQLLVVLAVLPSLLLLAGRGGYGLLRIGGASFAGCASVAWVVERLFGVATPADAIVDAIARHAASIATMLFILGLCNLVRPRRAADRWFDATRRVGGTFDRVDDDAVRRDGSLARRTVPVHRRSSMAHDQERQADALFRTLERDEEQYIKAARAVHDGKMDPTELLLLWKQLADAHEAWAGSFESSAENHEAAHG